MAVCSRNKKPRIVNKNLYNSIKKKVKARSKVWPSAYASGRLVREYKSKGGKYRCEFGSLDRWFKEKWVNVCKPKGKGYATCGRSKSSKRGYPYCRPLKRISSDTPTTVGELSKAKIKKMCSKKRKNPRKKVYLNFGEKKINEKDIMDKNQTCGFGSKQENTCGFGRRRARRFGFGDNLGPSDSNLLSFYQKGTNNSSHLTSRIRNCESVVYGDAITRSNYRFGKKKVNFIADAFKKSEKKGTTGSFTRWCKSHGYPKVTTACIKRGLRSKRKVIRKRAQFAKNIRSKGRKYSFGKKGNVHLNKINNDINYLKRL
jgi:hypothetical protein